MRRVDLPSAVLISCAAFACEQVLGLEEAHVDPTFPGSGNETKNDPGWLGDSGAGAAGMDGSGSVPTLCERYCDTVMANCGGDFAVYASRENCLSVCAHLPEGTEGDASGNTVHCRLRAAELAPSEVPYYCPVAGPGGNSVCGSNCSGFCALVVSICTGENEVWTSTESCLWACSQLSDEGSYTTSLAAEYYQGSHLQCRLYHVAAAADEPSVHCVHAAGGPPCDGP
jgi:hypothetical protein